MRVGLSLKLKGFADLRYFSSAPAKAEINNKHKNAINRKV